MIVIMIMIIIIIIIIIIIRHLSNITALNISLTSLKDPLSQCCVGDLLPCKGQYIGN